MKNENLILSNLLEIKEQLGELKTVAQATHEQAQKTNGRVTKLEAENNIRKGRMATVGAIGGFLASVLLFILEKLVVKLF